MFKKFAIVLLPLALISCSTANKYAEGKKNESTQVQQDNSFNQTSGELSVSGTFNGKLWQYIDGRAYSTTYRGKEMLSIRLVPFKLINRTSSDWISECYFGTPENTGKYFAVSLRVPNKVGQSQGGPNGFGDGILSNVNEYDSPGSVIGHLGQGTVEVEEILPEDKGFVRGKLDIEYQDADNEAANGRAAGHFKVLYCGRI
jgi:hypothetical protein